MEEDLSLSSVSPPVPYGFGAEKADLFDKIKPEEVVELVRNKLMGREYNKETGRWEVNPRLINNAISEVGASDFCNLILSVANPSTSISKLDDKEIRRRAYSILETAMHMSLANFKEYHITNTAKIRYITDMIYTITFIVLKHADDAGIREMIMSIRQDTYTHTDKKDNSKSLFRR